MHDRDPFRLRKVASPAKRATACSPGRVREPWGYGTSQAREAVDRFRRLVNDARGVGAIPERSLEQMLSPTAWASSLLQFRTQGSRTRPGLHAVARCAGLHTRLLILPRARRLALGYTLSPAARATSAALLVSGSLLSFAYKRGHAGEHFV